MLINCTESFQASEKISCSFEPADLSVFIENIVGKSEAALRDGDGGHQVLLTPSCLLLARGGALPLRIFGQCAKE